MDINLKWNKQNKDRLSKMLLFQPKIFMKSGASCLFVKLNKNIGVKLYRRKANRDFSHQTQLKAEKIGIAPKTGEKFLIYSFAYNYYDEIRNVYYGFVTQAADPPRKYKEQEITEIIGKMKKMNLCVGDLHKANLGRIKEKLVCIDFDKVSCKK